MKTINENEIDFYYVDISKGYHFEHYLSDLSSEEIKAADKLVLEKHRINFIIRRGLIRSILGQYLNLPAKKINYHYNEHRKPFIDPQQNPEHITFNVSNTADLLLIGISKSLELGVDVEKIKHSTNGLSIAESFFSEEEHGALKEKPKDQVAKTFCRMWTRKEAYIKAIGQGLFCPLKNFTVSAEEDSPELLWLKPELGCSSDWSMINIDYNEEFLGAAAFKAANKPVITRIQRL